MNVGLSLFVFSLMLVYHKVHYPLDKDCENCGLILRLGLLVSYILLYNLSVSLRLLIVLPSFVIPEFFLYLFPPYSFIFLDVNCTVTLISF